MKVSVIFWPKTALSLEGVETKSTEILSFKNVILYQVYAVGNLNPHRQKNYHLKKRKILRLTKINPDKTCKPSHPQGTACSRRRSLTSLGKGVGGRGTA